MDISIRQRRFSLSDSYTIKVGGEKLFTARRGFISLKIRLKDKHGKLRATIRKNPFKFGKSSYELLVFPEDVQYRFNMLSNKRGVWELSGGESAYTLYGHEGNAYSLFHGEHQIAACIKNEKVVGGWGQF